MISGKRSLNLWRNVTDQSLDGSIRKLFTLGYGEARFSAAGLNAKVTTRITTGNL